MDNREAARILEKWLKDATKNCTSDMLGYIDGWFAGYDKDAFVQAIQALKVVETLYTLVDIHKQTGRSPMRTINMDQLKSVLDEYMGGEAE